MTTNYDTREYRDTVGAVSMRALSAYKAGATGAGVKVAVIDSGIDLDSAEFAGRISSASKDTAGNSSIDDVGGHGTAVAFTLAGRRNGSGTQGVAFGAELIVLRTDSPGSCASTDSDGEPQCSHDDNAIAAALDVATTNGARVVNISLGGQTPNARLRNALSRATQAGVIVVISAGNDGTANPDPFAAVASNEAVARGLVIIAGSVGAGDQISSFSNRAGSGAAQYLAAVGESVRAPDENGTPYLWSGTSFSAPQIAGAVALLAQAFPNLTGAQIVEILFRTARDAGTSGTDAVYGRGILDLTRAFEPVGSTSVAGTQAATSLERNATLSAPMGDAAQAPMGTIILDGYSRAYAMDLARTINREGPARRLAGALQLGQRNVSAAAGNVAVALSIAPGRETALVQRLQLMRQDASRARVLAGNVVARLGSKAAFAFGASDGSGTLVARLSGRNDPAFLVARTADSGLGFDSNASGAMAFRRSLGAWGVSFAAERGTVLVGNFEAQRLQAGRDRFGYRRTTLAVDRRFGALSTGLALTRLNERDTLLGARFGTGLGGARASSAFVDASARYALGADWTLGAAWRQGWTQAHLRGGMAGSGMVRTSAFAFDLGKQGLFDGRDRFGLRIAQPLRVSDGALKLMLPADYDYASARVTAWDVQRLNLAPTGREIDAELSYARALGIGTLDANLFVRRQPGNFAMLEDDLGGAVRFTLGM